MLQTRFSLKKTPDKDPTLKKNRMKLLLLYCFRVKRNFGIDWSTKLPDVVHRKIWIRIRAFANTDPIKIPGPAPGLKAA